MNTQDKKLYLLQSQVAIKTNSIKSIVAFSYPKSFRIKNRRQLNERVDEILNKIDFNDIQIKKVINSLTEIELSHKRFKHKNYKFNSLYIQTSNLEKLRYIKYKYKVSISSVIRQIISTLSDV